MPRSQSQEKRQDWEEKLCKQRESGLSIKDWCHANQISIQTFYYWRDKIDPKVDPAQFYELVDRENRKITLECSGIHIHLDKHFDPITLKRCLEVLKEITC